MHNRVQLYELLSELGFVSIATTCYDFLYPPVPRWSLPVMRPLSLVMENTPLVKLTGRDDPRCMRRSPRVASPGRRCG